MIKKIVFSLLLVLAMSAYSQNKEINNYKYIIVQEKFDFLKKSDQYQTSSLTKFLLKKKGFTVFLSNEKLPKDLLLNRCVALTANVVDDSSMFTVKSKIELKDCFGNVLYSSQEGKSKEKDYKKGYQEAIRNAYNTMLDFECNYNSSSFVKKDVKIETSIKNIDTKKEIAKKEVVNSKPIEVLYAKTKVVGFDLLNTKKEIVFEILKTRKENVFIIKGKDGTLYKDENKWFAEFYKNNKLVKEQYKIKF